MDGDSGQEFRVRAHREHGDVVVTVSGYLDMVTSPRLASELDAILHDQPDMVVVDLTDLTFLASAGIEVLVETQRLSAPTHTEVRVVAQQRHIVHPIEVLGLTPFLHIHPTVESALAERNST